MGAAGRLAVLLSFWCFFRQQRKLMGSSAQNSSGVHCCRRRVRFNEVPEKVPKVPEKSGRLWCRARSGSTEGSGGFVLDQLLPSGV